MNGLTPLQAKTKAFVRSYIQANSYSPSYQDVADHLGLATRSGAHRVLTELIDRGHLRRKHNRARSLEVIDPRSPLEQYSTEALIAELNRRGIEA
jgi:repressor LexA